MSMNRNVKHVNLETVCGITSTLPQNQLVEIAFAGRSNVGKSSLINVLMNRKAYARTSQKPGKTQTINFYNINDAMYFVDLPGYGYAKVSLQEKMYEWCIQYGLNPVIIATKKDKIKRSQKEKQVRQIRDTLHPIEGTPIIPFSSLTKEGSDEIWEYIDRMHQVFEEEKRG